MDKDYQDIYYEKMEFNSTFNKIEWAVREIHIISISFGTEDIKILYKDVNGKYHDKVLMKKRFYRIVIE